MPHFDRNKKGSLEHDAQRQCGLTKDGRVVAYDYGVEDAFVEDGSLGIYVDSLPPLTAQSIIDFTNFVKNPVNSNLVIAP